MMRISQTHCSDECLIAHLDGELPYHRARAVRRHLEHCWQCRARLSEMEQTVVRVAGELARDAFPGPRRTVEARLRFLSGADSIADEYRRAHRPRRRPLVLRFAWAAASVAVLLGAWWFRPKPAEPPVDAREVMARMETAERVLATAPVRLQFAVTVRQIHPSPALHRSRLEVVSEPQRDRFTSRLYAGDGALLYAVWRPDSRRRYVFDSARGVVMDQPVRVVPAAEWTEALFRPGLTLGEFEAVLCRWLVERQWRPIALSSGVALLAAQDGSVLRAERRRPEGNEPVVWLSARRTAGTVTVEFAVEVDLRSYQPRVQFVRYQSPERTLELSLLPQPTPVAAAVAFEPPAAVSRPKPPSERKPAALPREPVERAGIEPAATRDAGEFEIEVRYALHRARSCVEEAVDLVRLPGGALHLRGVVIGPERQSQLMAALAPFVGPLLRVEIKTASEAMRELRAPDAAPPSSAVRALAPGENAARIRSLATHFSGDERAAQRFADDMLSRGENLMLEAQALRVLATEYQTRGDGMSVRARFLLEIMIRDHLVRIDASSLEIEKLLREKLLAAGAPPGRPEAGPAGTWHAALMEVFSGAKALNAAMRSMFAGRGAPASWESLAGAALVRCESLGAASRDTAYGALAGLSAPRDFRR